MAGGLSPCGPARGGGGRDDNFFENGGDSVRSLQVIREIEGLLDAKVPAQLLFDHQSLRAYAGAVAEVLLEQM